MNAVQHTSIRNTQRGGHIEICLMAALYEFFENQSISDKGHKRLVPFTELGGFFIDETAGLRSAPLQLEPS